MPGVTKRLFDKLKMTSFSTQVITYSIYVQTYYRPHSWLGKQKLIVGKSIVEEVFCKYRRGISMPENVELTFKIRITVRIVFPNLVPRKMALGSTVEAGSEFIGLCLPFAGVGAPTGGSHPLRTVAGGIAVDGKQHRIGNAVDE